VHPLAAVDAQTYWMSAKIPNDQFLLYAFAGEPARVETALDEARKRAEACPDLRLRVGDGGSRLRYPAWVSGDIDGAQLTVHPLDNASWQACLDAVTTLSGDQLDLRRMAWRLHVFTPVHGVPGAAGPATVAVLQVGHALADGTRSASLAGVLFGRGGALADLTPHPSARRLRRAAEAARTHRQLDRDTRAGLLPPPAQPRPALSTNTRPAGARMLRTFVRSRSELPGPTVTVGALAAVSAALSGYLRDRGEDPSELAAEVPMAKVGVPHARNHFGNVGVGLYPDLRTDERVRRIAGDLDDRRRRGEHPAFGAADKAFAAIPAPLLRWGVGQFDADVRSPIVTGNTVVSSVNRGPADLSLAGCPVILTAGYPALSPMMGLTHGVHGIGDKVAISVHAAESALADIDDYLDRLDAALRP
jgi:hypothetical protein